MILISATTLEGWASLIRHPQRYKLHYHQWFGLHQRSQTIIWDGVWIWIFDGPHPNAHWSIGRKKFFFLNKICPSLGLIYGTPFPIHQDCSPNPIQWRAPSSAKSGCCVTNSTSSLFPIYNWSKKLDKLLGYNEKSFSTLKNAWM